MSDIPPDAFDELLEKLRVPNFNPVEPPAVNGPEVLQWNDTMQTILGALQERVHAHSPKTDGVALAIARIAPLSSKDVWIYEDTRNAALSVLSKLKMDWQVFRIVLEKHVKPIFQANPHPSLQTATGRVLPRVAGGPMAAQDHYNEQPWKEHPGVDGTVSWCISRTTSASFESLWHLIIPPIMTFLDDFKVPYKLKGVRLVSVLLNNVPVDLLRRTGIGKLLSNSLSTAITFLHDPSTPDLIRETAPTIVKLIQISTAPDSEERFDRLSDLIGEGIIGGIWMYSRSDESEAIEASMDVLPEVVHALGIGTARYLNGLIPQCTFLIAPNDARPEPSPTNLSALKALVPIMEECQPRLSRFKGTIFEAVGKCWVRANETANSLNDVAAFKEQVTQIYALLLKACPSMEKEYSRCIATLPDVFGPVMPSR